MKQKLFFAGALFALLLVLLPLRAGAADVVPVCSLEGTVLTLTGETLTPASLSALDSAVLPTVTAVQIGEAVSREIGVDEAEAARISAEVRRLDAERFELELAAGGDLRAGRGLLRGNAPRPTPFTPPKREARPLNEAAAEAMEEREPGTSQDASAPD